jgi:DNA-binding winged helix-turn-helix (wHTH) protein
VQAQPFQLLVLLLENAGDVVTREEICRELWPADTFVDFEHSLAAAVNKIREALGDAADNPLYIETLPKRGYRFIGKIKPARRWRCRWRSHRNLWNLCRLPQQSRIPVGSGFWE